MRFFKKFLMSPEEGDEGTGGGDGAGTQNDPSGDESGGGDDDKTPGDDGSKDKDTDDDNKPSTGDDGDKGVEDGGDNKAKEEPFDADSASYELSDYMTRERIQSIHDDLNDKGYTDKQIDHIIRGQQKIEKKILDQQKETVAQLKVEAEKTLSADKELGGEVYEENKKLFAQGLKSFGDEKFSELVKEKGLDLNKTFFKYIVNIGKGKIKGGLPPSGSRSMDNDGLRQMYPSMFKD